jgi:hypothetical protein
LPYALAKLTGSGHIRWSAEGKLTFRWRTEYCAAGSGAWTGPLFPVLRMAPGWLAASWFFVELRHTAPAGRPFPVLRKSARQPVASPHFVGGRNTAPPAVVHSPGRFFSVLRICPPASGVLAATTAQVPKTKSAMAAPTIFSSNLFDSVDLVIEDPVLQEQLDELRKLGPRAVCNDCVDCLSALRACSEANLSEEPSWKISAELQGAESPFLLAPRELNPPSSAESCHDDSSERFASLKSRNADRQSTQSLYTARGSCSCSTGSSIMRLTLSKRFDEKIVGAA